MHQTIASSPVRRAHRHPSASPIGRPQAPTPRAPARGWCDEPCGLAERLAARHGGRLCGVDVSGPLGSMQRATYAFLAAGDETAPEVPLAVIDASAALGRSGASAASPLSLAAGSHGLGELIRAALNGGAQRILIDCDDSAGLDGGAGMAQALGARLLDRRGRPIGHGAAELGRLARIDLSRLDPRLSHVRLQAAVDWSLTLLGPAGLVGANRDRVDDERAAWLEAALERYAQALFDASGIEVAALPGGGAAGGAGAAAASMLGARLIPREHWSGTRLETPWRSV